MIENQKQDFENDGARTPAPELLSGQPASSGAWRRRLIRLALIWGIWTFIGIVFTLQSYFTSYRSEQPMTLVDAA
jgi:hypothetical protein